MDLHILNKLIVQINDVEFYWLHHRHYPLCALIQVLPNAVLQQLHADDVFVSSSRNINQINEFVYCLGSVAAPFQPHNCEQSGVVPPKNNSLFYELSDLPL